MGNNKHGEMNEAKKKIHDMKLIILYSTSNTTNATTFFATFGDLPCF